MVYIMVMAKNKKEKLEFNFEEHEHWIAERYRMLARFDAFDKLVDMALDGVISMTDAQSAWENEQLELPYSYGAE